MKLKSKCQDWYLLKQKIKVAGQGQPKRSNRQGQHHALKAQRITSDTDGVCGYETTEYLPPLR